MLPPLPVLGDYGLSPEHGFLPVELPLEVLPDPYYSRWEVIIANLQALLLSKRLRALIQNLPILSTSRLSHPAEWRRAYMVLSFMTHAYIWGGDEPEEVRPSLDSSQSVLIGRSADPPSIGNSVPQDIQTSGTAPRGHVCSRLSLELQTHIFGRTG